MLTPVQLKSHIFQQSGRNAYKSEDVDSFFAEVTASYEQMFRENGELIKRIGLLADKLEQYKSDEDIIKSAVLSAQRVADQIVREAKQSVEGIADSIDEKLAIANEEAEKIVSEAKAKAEGYETEVMGGIDEKYNRIIDEAQHKAASILADAEAQAKDKIGAATRNITHESLVYDMLKKEVTEFRSGLLAKYKAHIELISELPEIAADKLKTLEEIELREKAAAFAETLDEMPSDGQSVLDEQAEQIKQLEAVQEQSEDEETNDVFSGASPEIPEAAEVEVDEPEIMPELQLDDDSGLEFVSPEDDEPEYHSETQSNLFTFSSDFDEDAGEQVIKTELPAELFDEEDSGLEFIDDEPEEDEGAVYDVNDIDDEDDEPEEEDIGDVESLVENFEDFSNDEPVDAIPLDKAKEKKGFKLNLSALNFDDEEDDDEEAASADKPFRYAVIHDTEEPSEDNDWLVPEDDTQKKKGFFKKKK